MVRGMAAVGVSLNQRVDFGLFAEWAGNNLNRWEKLLGCTINDRIFETGVVVLVQRDTELDDLVLHVQFAETKRQYLSLGRRFGRTFNWVQLGSELAAVVHEKRRDQECRLTTLRSMIHSGAVPETRDCQWLAQNAHHEELRLCESLLSKTYLPAMLSRELREWGLAERALEVTAFIEAKPVKAQSDSPVWTTRGAAFADLWRMDEAKRCATTALECNSENHFAHNVLGRIYYRLGDRERTEYHFDKAEEGHRVSAESLQRMILKMRREARHGSLVDEEKGRG